MGVKISNDTRFAPPKFMYTPWDGLDLPRYYCAVAQSRAKKLLLVNNINPGSTLLFNVRPPPPHPTAPVSPGVTADWDAN